MYTPPGLDWIDLIEYYAFRLTLLISFLYTLYEVLKHKLKGCMCQNTLKENPRCQIGGQSKISL